MGWSDRSCRLSQSKREPLPNSIFHFESAIVVPKYWNSATLFENSLAAFTTLWFYPTCWWGKLGIYIYIYIYIFASEPASVLTCNKSVFPIGQLCNIQTERAAVIASNPSLCTWHRGFLWSLETNASTRPSILCKPITAPADQAAARQGRLPAEA
jgi:hypothetical protein